jgi:hypothetical protein
MKLRTAGSLFALGLSILAVKPALAHHSFEAEYDDSKTATLSGIVTEVAWQNPHAYIFINTKNEDGGILNMRLELGPPYALVRGGWKKDTVKIGDKVTVEGAAVAKDARNHWVGSLQSTTMVLASGDRLPTR